MSVLFSPFGNSQYFDENGDPAVGYTVTTYAAGSSTPLATYTDATGGSSNANPVTLNATGLNPAGQFWLTSGMSYKFVVKDASGVVVETLNGITGVNDPATLATADQWVSYSGAPTYIGATSFSVAGDQTSTFQVLRRLKSANSSGTIYSTIKTSAFSAGITTVTVTNDSGTLDSGLSAVWYSLLTATNQALPYHAGQALQTAITTDAGTSTTAAVLTNITTSSQSIVPKSANSKFLVECSFSALVTASGAGVNSVAGYQLYNNTTSANIGSECTVGVSTTAGANTQFEAPVTLRAIVTNTATTAVGFVLRATRITGTPTVFGTNHVWSITEIQS